MRRIILTLFILITLLPACGPLPTPLSTPDIPATTRAITGTMVAATLTAFPTNTATSIPSQTPLPPTETPPLPTSTPTPTETATPIPFEGTLASSDTSNLPFGYYLIENNTEFSANVSINGFTEPGSKSIMISYDVPAKGNRPFTIPYGTYHYIVYVGNKYFDGDFRINNKDKTTMRISLKKVIVVGP